MKELPGLATAAIVAAALTGCSRNYDGTGVVVQSDPSHASVTISHDAIAGYMGAMAMPFDVSDATLLEKIGRGDRVKFHLVVSPRATRIDRLDVISAGRPDAGLTRSPAVSTLTPLGAALPDFLLTNQHGDSVSLSSLHGQIVVVTFIYTRCPLPDYCPLLMRNFQEIRNRFPDALGKDLTLLSITFDPRYDTPDVLARYGEKYGVGNGWHLLTGSHASIERIAESFGVEYWPEEGMFTHTLVTAIIDRRGNLYAIVEGKNHSPAQLQDLVETALSERRRAY